MKKIGLLTFHQVTNYGAVLQCYALRKKILHLNYECNIIPYSCSQLRMNEKIMNISKNPVVSMAKTISQYSGNIRKRASFDTFLREKCGMKDITSEEVNWDYDAIVVGSDQVWNIKLTNYDLTYFINNNDTCKKISYAASFGENNFEFSDLEKLNPYLERFDSISVREKYAKKILNSICINDSTVVCDPVLLLEKEEWLQFIEKERKVQEPYILVYCIEKSKTVFEYARKKSKELGAKILYLNQNIIRENKDFTYIRGASPSEFLNYIYHAEFVVTNSFHGTAFSIVFNKKFAVDKFWHNRENLRVNEILEKFNLMYRTIQSLNEEKIAVDWNYNAVIKKLNQIRRESQEYLVCALR